MRESPREFTEGDASRQRRRLLRRPGSSLSEAFRDSRASALVSATPAKWSKGSVEDWATESLVEAKLAYCLPGTDILIVSGTKLGEDYCRFALPIIQLRLAQSAVRVASTLNQIFHCPWLSCLTVRFGSPRCMELIVRPCAFIMRPLENAAFDPWQELPCEWSW